MIGMAIVVVVTIRSRVHSTFLELFSIDLLLQLRQVSFVPASCKLLTRNSSIWVFSASLVGNDAEQVHSLDMMFVVESKVAQGKEQSRGMILRGSALGSALHNSGSKRIYPSNVPRIYKVIQRAIKVELLIHRQSYT
jgi:hypothetical protein